MCAADIYETPRQDSPFSYGSHTSGLRFRYDHGGNDMWIRSNLPCWDNSLLLRSCV